jgi:hypothetical protein
LIVNLKHLNLGRPVMFSQDLASSHMKWHWWLTCYEYKCCKSNSSVSQPASLEILEWKKKKSSNYMNREKWHSCYFEEKVGLGYMSVCACVPL